MKKLIILVAALSAATLLAGCDDAEQARKERCTELQNEASHALHNDTGRSRSEIRKEWDSLKCEQSDIIHG